MSRIQRSLRRVPQTVTNRVSSSTLDVASARHALIRFAELQERAVDSVERFKERRYERHAAALPAKEQAAERMRVQLLEDEQPVIARQVAPQVTPQRQPAGEECTGEEGTLLGPYVQALSEKLHCPLTRKMLHDPVIAADGWTYEREAIQDYMHTSDFSPVTGQFLHSRLTTNVTVQWMLNYVAQLKMQTV